MWKEISMQGLIENPSLVKVKYSNLLLNFLKLLLIVNRVTIKKLLVKRILIKIEPRIAKLNMSPMFYTIF